MSSRFNVRLSSVADANAVHALILSPGSKYIGNIHRNLEHIQYLYDEYQTFRLVADDSTTVGIVAYAEFRDYPNIPALPPDCWLSWLKFHYCINLPITLMNTLFLTSCVYLAECADALKEILIELFSIELRMEYLIIVRPPKSRKNRQSYLFQHFLTESFDELAKYAKEFFPHNFMLESCPNTQSLLVISAQDILPTIVYRRALPEDNDDVVDLLDIEMPELRKELGDYYIAEELLYQDKHSQKSFLIVAEFPNEDHVGGFLWLSSDIDIAQCVRDYELNQFGNLVNFNESEPHVVEPFEVVFQREKPAISLFSEVALKELQEHTILGGLQGTGSGTSVASISKFRITSISGKLFLNTSSTFYERESVYTKLKEIYEKLRSFNYYIIREKITFDFIYNTCGKSPENATPNDTSNVFVIKMCSIHTNYSVNLMYKFLIAALSAYPDRDYCVMFVPKRAKLTRSQQDMLLYFSLVSDRPSKKHHNDLVYILHRSTIQGELSVHSLRIQDKQNIMNYISSHVYQSSNSSKSSSLSLPSMINVHHDDDFELKVITYIMNDVLENPFSEYTVFTIRCGNSAANYEDNTFVGFVVLRHFYKYNDLRYHFKTNLSPLKNEERAEIIMLRLHPFFHIWSLQILRDIACKTGFLEYFYLRSRRFTSFTNDLAKNMMPIEPLPKKKVWYQAQCHEMVDNLYEQFNLPALDLTHEHVEVFSHCLLPNQLFTNDLNIVIIGFTNYCRAFLRQLIFQWGCKNTEIYNCLPNVRITVIVAPGVIESEYDTKFVCPICNDPDNCYLSYNNYVTYVRDCTERMDLRNWIQFVPASVEKIDRENKIVRLQNSCDINYDTLLLMCSARFGLGTDLKSATPVNFGEMNYRVDRILLLHKMQMLKNELDNQFSMLIYGSNLPTYECINFLITHGIEPKSISLVLPYIAVTNNDVPKMFSNYYDENIQYILEDMVTDLGMDVFNNLNFAYFNECPNMNFVTSVVFKRFPSNELVTIKCDLFISFYDSPLNRRSKMVFSQCNIEMKDNKILIDENYRTNDPNIYALGTYIKMRNEPNYQYTQVNPREAAEKLLHILKLQPDTSANFERRYAHPTYFQAQLPMNYFITKLTLPKRFIRNQMSDEYSCRLTTYNNEVFFRVRLNPRHIVDEIVCVCKKKKHLDYLEHVCGKHEAMLNNLLARYKAGQIKCFLKFFEEPWTELIMHEDFENMQRKNHELLRPLAEAMFTDVERSAPQIFALKQFDRINKAFLEQRLLSFLRERRQSFVNSFALPEDYPQSEDFRKSLRSNFSLE